MSKRSAFKNSLRELFLLSPGKFIKIDEIKEYVSKAKDGVPPSTATIRVYVGHLRNEGMEINAERGGGYRYIGQNPDKEACNSVIMNSITLDEVSHPTDGVTAPATDKEARSAVKETELEIIEEFEEAFTEDF